MFRALVMEKAGDAPAVAALRDLDDAALPAGDVTVAVEYSTLNYKDGLCLSGTGGGLVRTWPHVPGIDFSGTVESSTDPRYRTGDRVVLTGWRVGEVHWGGYAQKARVKADWLVPLPSGLTTRHAETVKRPLESETWAGCVDAVGGAMLARVLGQLKYGGSAAAVGLAGGAGLPASVIPFLLRGVNLLGIDSVAKPYADRVRAWDRIAAHLPMGKLEAMIRPAVLSDLPGLGAAILTGAVQGRVIVDVNR
mgnify:CR=1 FL=1